MNDLKIYNKKEDQPTLQDAQKFVGGLVEMIYLTNDRQMLVNEEGIMHNLPINSSASFVAGNVILGPALILEGDARWD